MSKRDANHTTHVGMPPPAGSENSATVIEYKLTYNPNDLRIVGAAQILLEWLLSTPEHEAELQRRMEAAARQDSPAGESGSRLDCAPRRKRKRAA